MIDRDDDFDQAVEEALAVANSDRDTQRDQWRQAAADHNRARRNRRGRRRADPYGRYGGIRKQPDQETP